CKGSEYLPISILNISIGTWIMPDDKTGSYLSKTAIFEAIGLGGTLTKFNALSCCALTLEKCNNIIRSKDLMVAVRCSKSILESLEYTLIKAKVYLRYLVI